MPLWYRGIIEEHNAVRNAAGLFDVSHMGRFSIKGGDATKSLNFVLPTDASRVKIGRAFYSTICNDQGGIIDDTVTCKLADSDYLTVVNASNREKDYNWLQAHLKDYSVELSDESENSALIAFQGPLAQSLLQTVADIELSRIRRFAFTRCKVSNSDCLVSRTGYTGEDGFEITVLDCPVDDPQKALGIWNRLLGLGSDKGVLPCGLGARDSLRLEAGMCLYGNDIDETTTPIEAALENIVSLEKSEDFVGRATIETQMKKGVSKKRIAFSMQSGGIPRHGHEINLSGQKIGVVTSGTFSPTSKNGIGMGYVPPEWSGLGQNLMIQIRAAEQVATVASTPFYDTSMFGYKRSFK